MNDIDTIKNKFASLGKVLEGTSQRSLRVVGPPGIGKTEFILRHLRAKGIPHHKVSGRITGFQLYQKLYERRGEDHMLLLDDSDSILTDADGLAIIKAATDTGSYNQVSWTTSNRAFQEGGIPLDFHYQGRLVMISNQNLETLSRSVRIKADLAAVRSRVPHFNFDIANDSPAIMAWIRYMALDVKILAQRTSPVPIEVVRDFVDYIADHRFTPQVRQPGLRQLELFARYWDDHGAGWLDIISGMEV